VLFAAVPPAPSGYRGGCLLVSGGRGQEPTASPSRYWGVGVRSPRPLLLGLGGWRGGSCGSRGCRGSLRIGGGRGGLRVCGCAGLRLRWPRLGTRVPGEVSGAATLKKKFIKKNKRTSYEETATSSFYCFDPALTNIPF
jgi:hypothetical protein